MLLVDCPLITVKVLIVRQGTAYSRTYGIFLVSQVNMVVLLYSEIFNIWLEVAMSLRQDLIAASLVNDRPLLSFSLNFYFSTLS